MLFILFLFNLHRITFEKSLFRGFNYIRDIYFSFVVVHKKRNF